MRRLWIWIPALALAGTLLLPSGPGRTLLAHPWGGLAPALAALAWTLDLATRRSWPGLPLYRRHLTLFLLLLLAGLGLRLPATGPTPGHGWATALGAAFGLALTCWPALGSRKLACLSWVRGTPRRPDPAAELILVADPHWSTELTQLRETAQAHPDADWLFLGDVFDVWVGLPGMQAPLQLAFLDWVAERRQAGRWVGLWLGNREFFLDSLSGQFDLIGEGIGGALTEEGLVWEHGDLVNAADGRYRLWNLVSRSSPMWLFARLLPKAAARALAHWLHRKLHTSNRAYKLAFPRAAFRRAAQEQPAAVFITGHFHSQETEANGHALPWAHEGRFMVWQNGQIQELPPASPVISS